MNDLMDGPVAPFAGARCARAEGPWSDLALHTIGWKAFQDLCSQVCEVVLGKPVEIFREAQDDGQDAVFLLSPSAGTTAAVGTVQCKHSSDPSKPLRVRDLRPEIAHIEQLVQAGQADTYVLMTSMSVDAPVAVAIRDRLRALGVRKPHILGRQYLVRTIRSNPRLRALVPQVYGLGDLTTILDQRFVQQTRALLDQWIPKLKVYVPTEPHRKAVRALSEHGIVLLLGNPSAGKSAIGAILSTIASEDMGHSVLSLASPRDFEAGWNPDDPKRFFWIDDAFGANVLREDYVQDWTTAFPKVQAAISRGNKFLLTSRDYIYAAAKPRLGTRNLPVFADKRAVVDVGALSAEEKAQILYNHIHFGNQRQSWKRAVRDHLPAVAEVLEFLPGIAERLGDPAFTKGLELTRGELVRFMQEPREHLVDTINALDDRLRAGLILIYVHQGALRVHAMDSVAAQTVSDLLGVPLPKILESLQELKGSFLRATSNGGGETWGFAHPTITDALTEILRERPHMMEALLRGATVEFIIGNFVCEGMPASQHALVVPATLDDILVGRLGKLPDEYALNTSLFRFLAVRASDQVFRRVVLADRGILARNAWSSYRMSLDVRIAAHARAHRLGLLDESLREHSADLLVLAATDDFDLSFFEHEDMLRLISPSRLVALGIKLQADVLPAAGESVSAIADGADLDGDPDSHFDEFSNSLDVLESMFSLDEATASLIESAREAIAAAVKDLTRRKAEVEEKEDDHSGEWSYMSSVSRRPVVSAQGSTDAGRRSVFEDVDR